MCTTFYFLCFTASLCSFVMFSRVFDFWYSIVLMSPRLSEYKHRDEPQQVHNHRHIFWLYRHSRWGVLILSARSMQSNGSLQRWAPIIETQWTCSFESVKSIKSQMLTDAFTCKLNLCFFQFCLPGELPVSNLHILNGGLLIAHMPDLLSACMELRMGGGQTQASVLNCSFGGDNWLVECFMSRQSQLRPCLLQQTRITWAETNREPLPGKRQMSVYTVHFQLSQQNTEWL